VASRVRGVSYSMLFGWSNANSGSCDLRKGICRTFAEPEDRQSKRFEVGSEIFATLMKDVIW